MLPRLTLLSGTIRGPKQVSTEAAWKHYLLSITPEDIQMQARTYLDMSKALRIQARPRDSAPK